jgi:UPF0755 protein
MKKYSEGLTSIAFIAFSFIFFASLIVFINLSTPVSFKGKWKEVEIPKGATYSKGIDILKDNGIIKNRLSLILLGRISMTDRKLKPGYYSLSATMSPLQIFYGLIEGRTIQYSITIPEGSTLVYIRNKLEEKKLVDDESWRLVYDKDFLGALNINAPSLEGYIFPDTYSFTKGIAPEIIFKTMVRRTRESINGLLMARAEELGFTENEVLTLASIIEKEAVFNEERSLISAVYHNRLKRNMRLQADPTVLYGVKKRWKRIRYRDLRRVTPYNTYKIKGLPPGPIASPGINSIEAALHPADVDYLYFVAKNDGTHYFSRTGKEHVKAVMLYQLNGGKKSGNGQKKSN